MERPLWTPKNVIAFFIFNIKSYQSEISHSDRVGKRLQDTPSGGHNYCTCTVGSDFTSLAVELYEEKEQWKKITSAKHWCNAFPSSAVVQSISPSLLLIETEEFARVRCSSGAMLMIQGLYCPKQLHWTWAYGSWENSCLILVFYGK